MSTPDRLVVAPHLRSSINFLSCRRVAISVDLFDASLSRRAAIVNAISSGQGIGLCTDGHGDWLDEKIKLLT